MKVIIAGTRDITDMDLVTEAVKQSGFEITEVVTGMARGVDILAEQYGYDQRLNIQRFYAKWDSYGKMAGKIRNIEMANYAEALIAVWDGKSTGTRHMIEKALEKGLKVYVYRSDTLTGEHKCPLSGGSEAA
jgi:glycerol-3-phosphate dehydrogenase